MREKEQLVMELRFDERKNIAYIKIEGLASSKQILEAFDIAVSSPKYKKGMGRLWDFTETDLSSIDSDTIREMAQHSLSYPLGINDVKVAFVTNKTLEYGLSRMFEAASNAKTPIRVFKIFKKAEEWMTERDDCSKK